ncbi:MAG: MFS transporter [Candidatus Nanopelagicales bacterium]
MSTASAEPAHAPSISPPHAAIALTTLILGAFVANINLSIANVALPDIGRDLDATTVQQTMVASMFTMGLAASVLYLGAIGDRYGRRKLLLCGAVLTIPAGLASAYAPNIEFLIGARFVAGLAAGLMFPTTLSLLSALWRGAAQTRAIALWSGVGGGAAALGGVIGGAMLEVFWWGSVFLFALPLAVVVIVLALRALPAKAGEEDVPVDHLGGVLSVIAVASLIMGIQTLPNGFSTSMGLLFATALVAGVLFFWRQKRAPRPLVDLDAASVPTFWVAALAGTITFGSLMGALFLGAQFTQNVLGYDSLKAALMTLPMSLMLIIISPFAGRMVQARGSRVTLAFGLVVVAVGFIIMIVTWHEGASVFVVLLSYAVVGAGVGACATPAAHALMGSLPVSRAGMGSAFTDLTRDFGGAIMQAIMGTLLAVVYANYFRNAFANLPPQEAANLSQEAAEQMVGSYQGAEQVAQSYPQASAERVIAAANEAFTEGKSVAYILALVLTLLALVLVLWKYPRRAQERAFFAQMQAQSAAEEAASANAAGA